MGIQDQYLLKYLQENFNVLEQEITIDFLDTITQINITQNINYTELLKIRNIEEIIVTGINIDISFYQVLSKLKRLEKLTFIDCNLNNLKYFDNNIKYLCFNNCQIDNIIEISKFNNLESLYLDETPDINLDYFPNLKNIINLSFMNTKVLNSNNLIYLDKIENLCLTNSNIDKIDTLIENETLKTLVIDQEIYKNNKEVIKHLINRGVKVVDYLNRNVVEEYE